MHRVPAVRNSLRCVDFEAEVLSLKFQTLTRVHTCSHFATHVCGLHTVIIASCRSREVERPNSSRRTNTFAGSLHAFKVRAMAQNRDLQGTKTALEKATVKVREAAFTSSGWVRVIVDGVCD